MGRVKCDAAEGDAERGYALEMRQLLNTKIRFTDISQERESTNRTFEIVLPERNPGPGDTFFRESPPEELDWCG